MPIDPIQKPNIGTPDFARRRQGKKLMAIVTTIAFAMFWIYALWIAHAVLTGGRVEIIPAILCVLGLVLGVWGRRQVDKE